MDGSALSIVKVAEQYFPFITHNSFHLLFRFNSNTVEFLCHNCPDLIPRNVLILLYHMRFYPPADALGVIFGLSTARAFKVVIDTIHIICKQFGYIINTDGRDENKVHGFDKVFLVVDGTEVPIVASDNENYSGKKKRFTLKYQLLVGATTGKIHHIYGPTKGKIHDSKLHFHSKVGQWMTENNEKCFGDLGYVGCTGVVHPVKRTHQLTADEIEFNRKLSKIRCIVERTIGNLKKWQILRTVYRGAVRNHFKIFYCCCILTELLHINSLE